MPNNETMSETLNKTVSFEKITVNTRLKCWLSPPAGTVALARGGLCAPATTSSRRNQSNGIGKLNVSSLWEVKPEQESTIVQKIVLASNHPVTAVGQHVWSQTVISALYYRLQTGRQLNAGGEELWSPLGTKST